MCKVSSYGTLHMDTTSFKDVAWDKQSLNLNFSGKLTDKTADELNKTSEDLRQWKVGNFLKEEKIREITHFRRQILFRKSVRERVSQTLWLVGILISECCTQICKYVIEFVWFTCFWATQCAMWAMSTWDTHLSWSSWAPQ